MEWNTDVDLLSSQLINAVVLLILLSALNDPVQYRYHLTSSELGTDIDVMDDASKCDQLDLHGSFFFSF